MFHQRIGQGFNIIGTGGRIDHLVEVRFFLQDNLNIAGDAFGKIIGFAESGIKGLYQQGIASAQNGGHGFGGEPQHVDMRIIQGLVPVGGYAVNENRDLLISCQRPLSRLENSTRAALTLAISMKYLDPTPRFHCICLAISLASCPCIGKLVHVFGDHGQSKCQFLHSGCAGIAEQVAVHRQYPETGQFIHGSQQHFIGILQNHPFRNSKIRL